MPLSCVHWFRLMPTTTCVMVKVIGVSVGAAETGRVGRAVGARLGRREGGSEGATLGCGGRLACSVVVGLLVGRNTGALRCG